MYSVSTATTKYYQKVQITVFLRMCKDTNKQKNL